MGAFCSPRGLGKDVFLHAQKIFAVLKAGSITRNSCCQNFIKAKKMPRRKSDKPEELLSRNIIVRVTEKQFASLEKLRKESSSLSIAEICRKILSSKQIKLFKQDISMNPVMEELALIRKELKAIGININQITRHFNQDKSNTGRSFFTIKVANQYQKVDDRVEKLLTIISKLAEKWLQE